MILSFSRIHIYLITSCAINDTISLFNLIIRYGYLSSFTCFSVCNIIFLNDAYFILLFVLYFNNPKSWFLAPPNSLPLWIFINFGAASQYYKQSVMYKETLHYMNTAFTALFSIECMLKIISFGVRVSWPSALLTRSIKQHISFYPILPSFPILNLFIVTFTNLY